MIIVTQNSAYEFDDEKCKYRKIRPSLGLWKTYDGFLVEPCVGKRACIIRDANTVTTTSRVFEILKDEDE